MGDSTATAIIAAGGKGLRAGGGQPKQFVPLAGRPMLWYTLDPFSKSAFIDHIVLVVPEADIEYCRQLFGHEFPKLGRIVGAGEERHHSVAAGVAATEKAEEYILIHDGARPFVSVDLIKRVVLETVAHGAAIAAMPAKETIKVVGGGVVRSTPNRESLWCAQTPQGFRRQLLVEASSTAGPMFLPTDEAMLVEQLGVPVRIVEGEDANIKITTQADMRWAEWSMQVKDNNSLMHRGFRIGNGYDVHRFAGARKLILGGVHIPSDQGLEGHSDADVLTHAIIDALLGAAGLGDIGRLFPDTEAAFAGISSLILLARVRARIMERGLRVANLDAIVIAEQPKLSAYISDMEETLAATLGIPRELVSVKATTTEGLGFVGRREGIAAQSVVLLM